MTTDALYSTPVRAIDGTEGTLAPYQGKALLIVNVASGCGLTPQYEGLQKLYEAYADRGLVVLGFPANDFGAQEPGTNEEIQEFCRARYDVSFPLFAKIVVKGEGQHPLYRHLTAARPEAWFSPDSTMRANLEKHGLGGGEPGDILWNFEKFLVDRNGRVAARFAPDVKPDDPALVAAVEDVLAKD